MSRKHFHLSRTGTTLALTGAAVIALAIPAAAHVTVSSDDSVRGADDAILTFRVPNEQDKATVTSLQVTFPTDDPIASVDAIGKPGWSVTTKAVTYPKPITTDDGTITGGTGVITWTTPAASGIPVGQADTFQALVGPLPDAPSVSFRAVQTYSDGTVVSWIQPTIAGQPDPDHPAPVLTLAADTSTPAGTAASASAAPTVTATKYATTSDASTAKTLGIVGIVVGVLGLAAGGFAVSRRQRPLSPSASAGSGRS